MRGKTLPYSFLILLLLILAFILGVRYGKKVEQTNETTSYLLKLTPTQGSPTITPAPRLIFSTYKKCDIQFMYPESLKKMGEDAVSVDFSYNGRTALYVLCDPVVNKKTLPLENVNIATKEITFKKQKITAQDQDWIMRFIIKNPQTDNKIEVGINPDLYPLFESTLQFLAPGA